MSKVYKEFETHEHRFNTFFLTSLSVGIALFVGGVLAKLGFFMNNGGAWFVIMILVVTPAIVFLGVSGEKEFKTAYYKRVFDQLAGRIDQRKILKQFFRQYQPESTDGRLEDIEVDGRWNFHPDTNYIHNLAEQRDLLLSQIHQEYENELTKREKVIIETEKQLDDADTNLTLATKIEESKKKLLDQAKSAGEIYKQRHEYTFAMQSTSTRKKERSEAKSNLKNAQKEKVNLCDNYEDEFYRVTKIYNTRYRKYTEFAIRKINRINGLKYEIVDMPKTDGWVSTLLRKEQK